MYSDAENHFINTPIKIIKDARGIILRYEFESANKEFEDLSISTYKKAEYFLAKIENPVIIEVHTIKDQNSQISNFKNWEFSTIIANRIESLITEPAGIVEQRRIHSVGYGEFLPAKNPSNNGGKYSNRVDIIILCNISGE